MDDGPRTGGLQALLIIIGGTAAYVTFGAHAYGAAPFLVLCLGLLVWSEIYARRRAREDREERERYFRDRQVRRMEWSRRPELPGQDADYYDEGYDPFNVPGR
jgi:type IV secretory pathway TrbD component